MSSRVVLLVCAAIASIAISAPVLAQTSVTLASAPSGTTSEANPEISVDAPGKVSYRYSLNGGPYSPEVPVTTPIKLTGGVGVWYGHFTAGTGPLADFLATRSDPAAFYVPFFDQLSVDHLESQLQVTYTVNPKRLVVQPDNVLALQGAGLANFYVALLEKLPPEPRFELSALGVGGGVLSESSNAGGVRQFSLALPPGSGPIALTPQANNDQTQIAVNGQPVLSGQTVSLPAPADGSSIAISTTGPNGVQASYVIGIRYDSTLVAPGYRSFFLRAFSPDSAYVSIQNLGSDTISYGLAFNQKFGLTMPQLVQEAQAMAPEYLDEPIQSKVWRFIRDNRYHFLPFSGALWNQSPALFLNSIGFGFCDDSASVFAYFMIALGYPARVWALNGHVVPEVFVNNRWEMWDDDLEVYYRNRVGQIAGVEELAADPDLITQPLNPLSGAAALGAYDQTIADIYSSTADNVVNPWYTQPSPLNDSPMTFSVPPGGAFEFPDVYDGPLLATDGSPVPSYANARLIVPAGYEGSVAMPLVIQSIGWSSHPHLYVVTKDAAGNWDAQPTVASWAVDVQAPFTVATQPSGSYNDQEPVTLTASEAATIYYTTDGSTPTVSSLIYTGPVTIGSGAIVKFFAVDQFGNQETQRSYGPPIGHVQLQIVNSSHEATMFVAAVSGTGVYEYMFLLCQSDNCVTTQFYSASNIWTWNKAASSGQYQVKVWVRSSGAKVDLESGAQLSLSVSADAGPTLVNPGDQADSDGLRTYPDAVLSSLPLAYWRLDETGGANVADGVGGNLGTLLGGVTPGQPGPLADGDGALGLDGVTGYVRVPNSPELQQLAGDLTIELWVNVASLANRQTLISKSYLHEFELTLETSGGLNLYQGNGTTYSNAWSQAGPVKPNAWQYVVVTRTAATQTVAFYVNGVAQGGGVSAIVPTAGSNGLAIGRTAGGLQYVNGLLDEVALYARALSPEEIATHWAMRLADGTGTPVSLPLVASDPDGDALTYSASGLPPGLTTNAATGLISGTLTAASAGTYPVVATVSDGVLAQSQTFNWTVTHVNHPPKLASPGNQSSSEGTTVALQLVATDADGDALTYSATGLPQSLVVDPVTGLISGTLPSGCAGTYTVTVAAADAAAPSSQVFTWVVAHANRAPVVDNPGTQSSPDRWSYGQAVTASAPVAYWRLDETSGPTLADSAGGNVGTLVGGVLLGQPGALADGDGAVRLDGVTGYVQLGNSAGLQQLAGDLTIELWVNVASLATRQTLISKGYLHEFELTVETDGTLSLYQGNGAGYSSARSVWHALTANVWQHVVVTRVAATQTIAFYVNGVAQGGGASTIVPTTGASGLAIGRTTGGRQYVRGLVDEVALYAHVLSLTEIATHWALRLADGTGTPVSLPLVASDPDGDALTYSASGLPSGLTIDPATGLISGMLRATAGSYGATVTVSDGHLTQSQSFTWIVTHTDRAPVLTGPAALTNADGSNYAQAVLASAPVAYWRLDETSASVADRVGGNNGTLTGGVTPGQPGALAGGDAAVLLDGANGYVQVANSPSLQQLAGDLTIELWVNAASLATRQTLISKSYLHEFELTVETDGTLNLYQGNGTVYSNARSFWHALMPNAWQHVAVTRAAATQTIAFYVNGVAQGGGVSTVVPTAGSSPLAIGRTAGGLQYVSGLLDEVALYSRVLSPAEIVTHWAMRLADGTGTPVALPLVASDPDGDALTYSASGLPPGLTINGATGLISGTLTAASTGTYTVTATVSDGHLSQSRTFTWTVEHVNRAPVLINPGAQTDPDVWRYAQAVLVSAPVAYWRLDETGVSVADGVSSNTGTLVGGVVPGQPGALADGDGALGLDGATGYVQVANSASLQQLAGDLTIELWVNVSLAKRQTLISKSYLEEFELTVETDGTLNLYQGNGTAYSNARSVSHALTANTWQHVVVTRTTATQTIAFYVNGNPRGSGMSAVVPTAGSSGLAIGRTAGGLQNVSGLLDEVALYARSLGPAEIATHWVMRLADGTGTPVVLPLVASDPDGDVLTYSATGLPPGVTIDAATGFISGMLTTASVGAYSVTATVSDGILAQSQTFTWTVID